MMTELEDLKGSLAGGCPVCGGSEFSYQEVLWPELIAEWQLNPAEAKYINLQQGFQCRGCEANLRAMTLAHALSRFRRWPGTLLGWVASEDAQAVKMLEVNEAFNLGRHWQNLPGRQFVRYPETDMHALPFADETFDFVVHSDTLEHVENPVHALEECRRVLKPDGALGFTVPIVVGRLTRSRSGLPPSYHGREGDHLEDHRVASEFGADVWTALFEAGFRHSTLVSLIYPASVAILAER
jgi:SAM-dependent methyltransferase